MPLVVPGVTTQQSGDKTEEWMNKLVGKKLSEEDASNETVSQYLVKTDNPCNGAQETSGELTRAPLFVSSLRSVSFPSPTESSSLARWSPRTSILTGSTSMCKTMEQSRMLHTVEKLEGAGRLDDCT